jgi:hypothetical protein
VGERSDEKVQNASSAFKRVYFIFIRFSFGTVDEVAKSRERFSGCSTGYLSFCRQEADKRKSGVVTG